MDSLDKKIEKFLAASAFATVGASRHSYKYGYKVHKCYQQNSRKSYPINPREQEVLGDKVYPRLADLPETVKSISVITPPDVTEMVVEDAIEHGVESIWMQPGAESEDAVTKAEAAGIEVIHGGACLLVVLGYRE